MPTLRKGESVPGFSQMEVYTCGGCGNWYGWPMVLILTGFLARPTTTKGESTVSLRVARKCLLVRSLGNGSLLRDLPPATEGIAGKGGATVCMSHVDMQWSFSMPPEPVSSRRMEKK